MTAKQFFKSTAFKCIIALLCVLLISGVFLTIMNSLLEVSDEERLDRAISKIYGKSVKTETVVVADYNDNATVEEAYRVKDDGNYLIKVTGKGGYSGGTVTCWVVVKITGGAVKGVDKVVIDSNKGQTQMAEITSSFLDQFSAGYQDGVYYTTGDGFLVTGSTRTSNAICNAVNGAIDFVNALFGNVGSDIYKENEFEYLDAISTKLTTHKVNEDRSVDYTIVTNGYGNAGEFTIQITVGRNGKISKYEIVTNGSTGGFESSMDDAILSGSWFEGKSAADVLAAMGGKIDYDSTNAGLGSNGLATGATQSSYLCIQAAVFATANYEKCVALADLPEEEAPDNGGENGAGGEEHE